MIRRMIVVTNLDVWILSAKANIPGAGNQSLYNTLLGYARAGWEVHMLTTSRLMSAAPQVHPRVHVHRRPIRWFEFLRRVKRALRSLPGRRQRDAGPRVQTSMAPQSKWKAPYAWVFRITMGRRAVRLARRVGGVDFVYGHEALGALAGRYAADRIGVPLVTRFQGTELGQLLDAPARLQAHTVLVEAYRTPADLIIMANDGTRGNEVLDLLGVPRERYRFYMNGVVKDDVYRPEVDVAAIRRRHGIGEDEAFILYTGRFFYWKRIDRHLEVLARVAKRFDRFKAVFIGDGPEMDGVRALCRERGLQDRALFLGAMTHDQVMNYLNACDVYISFHDLTNLCNPAIEACVCGKCIVTSAVGGTTDLLTDGVNAAVVEPHDDVAAITEALLRVLEDPKERARLAQGAKRRGRDLKTWEERMVMEVAEVEKMLASRS